MSSDSDHKLSSNLTLYYFPTSFSSQKVLFAFYEKNVPFKTRLVCLFDGQHMEPWYISLNPNGVHVPVLQAGEDIITVPEDIIDHVDKYNADSIPVLVPDIQVPIGQQVDRLRKQLDSVPVDVITYGIIFHPHLSHCGCKISSAVQRSMKDNFTKRLTMLTQRAAKHPDLRDCYLVKSQISAQIYDTLTDEEKVKRHLVELEELFDEIEKELTLCKQAIKGSSDYWLCGKTFTAADISLAILLTRLSLLGLDTKYFPNESHPLTFDYHARIQKRPAFLKIQQEVKTVKRTLLWENLKAASPYVFGFSGVVIGSLLTLWIFKKYK